MDSSYPPYPDQDYIVAPNGSGQGTAPNSNMKPPTPVDLDQFALDESYPELVDESTIDAYQWNSPYNAHTASASAEVQGAFENYDYNSVPGMYLNEQPCTALNKCDRDSNSLHRMTSPYTAHVTSASVDMVQWLPNEDFTAQSPSAHLNSMVSQPDSIMMQSMQLPGRAVEPVTQQLRYADDASYAEQEQGQIHLVRTSMPKAEDGVTRIGSVLSNGKFGCDAEECKSLTFARQAELRRHHTTLHAANKPDFWCQVPTCPRSIFGGGEAFHRKDKLADHVQRMHPDVQQVYS